MGLNHRQIKAIPLILSEDTIEKAAKKAGVARSTMCIWLRSDEFKRALTEARRRELDRSMRRLSKATMAAVLCLERLLNAENENVRRGAASDILTNALRWREISEIEDRLQSVERIILERRTYESAKAHSYLGEGG